MGNSVGNKPSAPIRYSPLSAPLCVCPYVCLSHSAPRLKNIYAYLTLKRDFFLLSHLSNKKAICPQRRKFSFNNSNIDDLNLASKLPLTASKLPLTTILKEILLVCINKCKIAVFPGKCLFNFYQ